MTWSPNTSLLISAVATTQTTYHTAPQPRGRGFDPRSTPPRVALCFSLGLTQLLMDSITCCTTFGPPFLVSLRSLGSVDCASCNHLQGANSSLFLARLAIAAFRIKTIFSILFSFLSRTLGNLQFPFTNSLVAHGSMRPGLLVNHVALYFSSGVSIESREFYMRTIAECMRRRVARNRAPRVKATHVNCTLLVEILQCPSDVLGHHLCDMLPLI